MGDCVILIILFTLFKPFIRLCLPGLLSALCNTFARAGYGGYAILLGSPGSLVLVEGGILTGVDKSHFEAAIGMSYFMEKEDNRYLTPAVSFGYRLQKPGGRFIFRTGLGYPEGLYVGFGVGL